MVQFNNLLVGHYSSSSREVSENMPFECPMELKICFSFLVEVSSHLLICISHFGTMTLIIDIFSYHICRVVSLRVGPILMRGHRVVVHLCIYLYLTCARIYIHFMHLRYFPAGFISTA